MARPKEISTQTPGIKPDVLWPCHVRSAAELRDLRKSLLSWCLERELSDQETDRVSAVVSRCGIGKYQTIDVGDQAVKYSKWIGLGSVSESWKTSGCGRRVIINRRARPLGLTTVTYLEAISAPETVSPAESKS